MGPLRGDDANPGGVGQPMGPGMIGAVFFQRHQLGLATDGPFHLYRDQHAAAFRRLLTLGLFQL